MGNQAGCPGGGRRPPTEEEKKRQRERRREDGNLLFLTSHSTIFLALSTLMHSLLLISNVVC